MIVIVIMIMIVVMVMTMVMVMVMVMCKMVKLFQNVFRLLGKLSITPVTLFTPTVVLFEDLGPIC